MAKGDSPGLYTPSPYSGQGGPDLAVWVAQELQRISQAAETAIARQLDIRNSAIARPRQGQIAYADGVNWDPGNGAGPYVYTGTTWLFMAGGVPAGSILDFGGTVAPTGYLLADGSNRSRTTFAGLFTAYGTVWGVGDGVTTFGTPDFRRKVGMGSGGVGTGTIGNAVGNAGGEENHVLTIAELASHLHALSGATAVENQGFNHNFNVPTIMQTGGNVGLAPTAGSWDYNATLTTATQNQNHTHNLTGNTGSTGSGTGHNTIQPSLIVLKIIKT